MLGIKSKSVIIPNLCQEVTMIGMKYSRLTVLRFEKSEKHQKFWRCVCVCGKEKVASTKSLNRGDVKSCGCLQRETRKKNSKDMHKKSGATKRNQIFYIEEKRHPLVHVLKGMKSRCYNSNNKQYRWYGAKGVKVCDEWTDTENFIIWAEANGYKAGLTIDRIDSNKDYCPENCRFITRSENTKKALNERYNPPPTCQDYYPEVN